MVNLWNNLEVRKFCNVNSSISSLNGILPEYYKSVISKYSGRRSTTEKPEGKSCFVLEFKKGQGIRDSSGR